MKKTSSLLLLALAAMLGITSCSSWKHSDFADRKYMKKFKHTKFEFDKDVTTRTAEEATAVEAVETAPTEITEQTSTDPVLETTLRQVPEVKAIATEEPVAVQTIAAAPVAKQEKIAFNVRNIKPRFGKLAMKKHHQITAEPIVEVLLAIFLPPIGVLIHDDGITSHFWVSLLLTLLFWLPGAIYALLYVTGTFS